MGFMDEIKRLTRPYDEDEDEFVDEAEAAPPRQPQQPQPQAAPARPKANPFSNFNAESASASRPASAPRSTLPREGRVVNMSTSSGATTQVMLIRPERFENAAEIADHLRSQRAVLMNMETTPREVTRRLVDFLSGVTYAIDGNIRKVAASTYMLTPPSVDLVTDQLNDLEASGVLF